MREPNNIVNTNRHTTLSNFRRPCWLLVSVLLLSACASPGTLRIARPPSGHGDPKPGVIATGATFAVGVYRSRIGVGVGIAGGKIPFPVIGVATSKEYNVKITEAKVDNPSIVEIIKLGRRSVTLRAKVPGETTLRVKARGKLGNTQTATATVGSVAPNAVRLEPNCRDYKTKKLTPVRIPVNEKLYFFERLYSDKTPLLAYSYPEVDFGALISLPRKGGKEMWKAEYLGIYGVEVKAPATATMTSLKIPAYGYELPVQVYELSDVSALRILAPESVKKRCKRCRPFGARVEYLVGGQMPCVRPRIPLTVTIGPTSVCDLQMPDIKRGKVVSDHTVYEVPRYLRRLKITGYGVGTCVVSGEAKGIGKSTSVQIDVKPRR